MIDLRKALGAKAVAAGLIGILAAGGVGVAAAGTDDSQTADVPTVEQPETLLPSTVSGLNPDLDAPDVSDITDLPEAEVPGAPEVGDPDDGDDVGDGDVDDPDDGDVDATRPDNFGATVSADARGESDGVRGVDGREISAAAKAKHDDDGTDDDADDDGTDDGTDDDADDGADDDGAGQAGQGAGHGRS